MYWKAEQLPDVCRRYGNLYSVSHLHFNFETILNARMFCFSLCFKYSKTLPAGFHYWPQVRITPAWWQGCVDYEGLRKSLEQFGLNLNDKDYARLLRFADKEGRGVVKWVVLLFLWQCTAKLLSFFFYALYVRLYKFLNLMVLYTLGDLLRHWMTFMNSLPLLCYLRVSVQGTSRRNWGTMMGKCCQSQS